MPMSSPKMTRMFGLRPAGGAAAGWLRLRDLHRRGDASADAAACRAGEQNVAPAQMPFSDRRRLSLLVGVLLSDVCSSLLLLVRQLDAWR